MQLTNRFLKEANRRLTFLKRIQSIHMYKDGWVYFRLKGWIEKRMPSGDKLVYSPEEVTKFILDNYKAGVS